MQTSAEGEGVTDETANATISSTMFLWRKQPAPTIVAILVGRRCRDITGQLDLGKCGHCPVNGGGFGDIYQGALLGGEKIAIKCARLFVQQDDIDGRKGLKRTARELDVWSHFEHENVLKLLGLALFRDKMAMISPWMDQGTLLQYLKRNPVVDRCQLCIDISEGVAYLHQNDTIHGDIKSANVLISAEGVAKLTDFGCTKLNTNTLCFTATTSGQSLSTRWAAPEILHGGPRSKEADVYALGMTLLEVITGVMPFSDKADIAVQVAVLMLRQMPERPKEFPSFSPNEANELWAIVVDSCAHDPSDRPGSITIRDRAGLNSTSQDKKRSERPSPEGMTSDSVLNTTVNEHGRPQTLSVPPDGTDEGEDGYGEYSGDDDHEEYMDVDDEEDEPQCMSEASCILLYAHNPSFITALTGDLWSYQRDRSVALTSNDQRERRYASPPFDYPCLPPPNYRPPGEANPPVPYLGQLPPLQVNPSPYHHSKPPRNLPSPGYPRIPPSNYRPPGEANPPAPYPGQLPPLQVNPSPYHHSEPPRNPPSPGYPRMPPSNYPPGEAAVSINRPRQQQQQQQWYPAEGMSTEPAQVPYISSVMSPYAHPHVPSRVMPPLSELDRRVLPTVEESSTPGPKPHVCDQCGAAFSRAHDLKRHVETHKVSSMFLLLARTEANERRTT
ncbi:hypothetical protein FRC09_002621 [Ceratobasidium sp. 395]|nr:hypothetical protein FRC09_002621 [Ceratobasidium sp. 395]